MSGDPDGEFIDDIVITPANTHDADLAVVDGLLADHADADDKPTVMGDSAYASPDTIDHLEHDGFEVITKVPAATNGQGMFTKDDFGVDVERERVVCPAGCIVPIRFSADGSGRAEFGFRCAGCPKREQCTTAVSGRTITVHRREDILHTQEAGAGPQRVASRLPRRPAEGGTQDRPLHAGHVGRPQPAPEGENVSRPTPSPAPLSSTWPAWRLSTLPSPTVVGQQQRHDRDAGEEPILNAGQRPEVPGQGRSRQPDSHLQNSDHNRPTGHTTPTAPTSAAS